MGRGPSHREFATRRAPKRASIWNLDRRRLCIAVAPRTGWYALCLVIGRWTYDGLHRLDAQQRTARIQISNHASRDGTLVSGSILSEDPHAFACTFRIGSNVSGHRAMTIKVSRAFASTNLYLQQGLRESAFKPPLATVLRWRVRATLPNKDLSRNVTEDFAQPLRF